MKMAEECTDQSSVATSSLSLTNWWDHHHHHHHASSNDFSSWHHQQQNPNSNNSSSEDQDVSISTTSYTNVSNHSGITVDQESSGRQLFHETGAAASNELITSHTSDSQLWRQVLFCQMNPAVSSMLESLMMEMVKKYKNKLVDLNSEKCEVKLMKMMNKRLQNLSEEEELVSLFCEDGSGQVQ